MRLPAPSFLLIILLLLAGTCSRADEVTIHWQDTEGVSKYELLVKHDRGVVLHRFFPGKTWLWKGNLPFGLYQYRIRAIDSAGRRGPWAAPVSFLVTPNPPALLVPARDSTVVLRPRAPVTFRWSQVGGIRKYLLEIRHEGNPLLSEIIEGNEHPVSNLVSGDYTWTVKPVLDASELRGTGAESQVLNAKASESWRFKVEPLSERGDLVTKERRLTLELPLSGPDFRGGDEIFLWSLDRPGKRLGGGKVLHVSGTRMKIALAQVQGDLAPGREVYVTRKESRPKRILSSVPTEERYRIIAPDSPEYRFDLALGAQAGTSYVLPSFWAQWSAFPQWSFGTGISSAYASSLGSDLHVYGVWLTSSVYPLQPLSELFGEAGLGFYGFFQSAPGGISQTQISPAGFMSVGWAWRPWDLPFRLSLAAGAQYVAVPANSPIQTALRGLLPLTRFTFGFSL